MKKHIWPYGERWHRRFWSSSLVDKIPKPQQIAEAAARPVHQPNVTIHTLVDLCSPDAPSVD